MNHTGSNTRSNVVAIIPARFASSRLPGKPLLDIAGKPMICHVIERALAARQISRAIVATDDARVVEAVRAAGHEAMMTAASHCSGTDRLAEVAATLEAIEIVVNVQGDEPLIAAATIERAVNVLLSEPECEMATVWESINDPADVTNPDVVKIVVGDDGSALYFSRAPVPFPAEAVRRFGSVTAAVEREPGLLKLFRKHTGLYVYRRDFLLRYAGWPQSALERAESLEQLRALERGVRIKAVEAFAPSVSVDTPADLERVRRILSVTEFIEDDEPGLSLRPSVMTS